MTDFVTIKESTENHKGSFKGTCIKASDLKAGTGQAGDWTMKRYTLEDPSGQVEIACFNEEINFFKVGCFYEVENPWWKERNDKPGEFSCAVGKYCKVTLIENPPTQTTIPQSTEPEAEIPPEPKGPGSVNGEEIPPMNQNLMAFTNQETVELLQIRNEVLKTCKIYFPQGVDGGLVGMMTKEIYRESKKSNFQKLDDPED